MTWLVVLAEYMLQVENLLWLRRIILWDFTDVFIEGKLFDFLQELIFFAVLQVFSRASN